MRIALFALVVVAASAQDWPSFRGPGASGVADGQNLPVKWDVQRASMCCGRPDPRVGPLQPGRLGRPRLPDHRRKQPARRHLQAGTLREGTASDDLSVHQWKVICLDRGTGKVLWERTAYQGVPKEKRHIKSTYANSTPATDGRVVVAFFGSQGLYAYSLSGDLLWKRDLGRWMSGPTMRPSSSGARPVRLSSTKTW